MARLYSPLRLLAVCRPRRTGRRAARGRGRNRAAGYRGVRLLDGLAGRPVERYSTAARDARWIVRVQAQGLGDRVTGQCTHRWSWWRGTSASRRRRARHARGQTAGPCARRTGTELSRNQAARTSKRSLKLSLGVVGKARGRWRWIPSGGAAPRPRCPVARPGRGPPDPRLGVEPGRDGGFVRICSRHGPDVVPHGCTTSRTRSPSAARGRPPPARRPRASRRPGRFPRRPSRIGWPSAQHGDAETLDNADASTSATPAPISRPLHRRHAAEARHTRGPRAAHRHRARDPRYHANPATRTASIPATTTATWRAPARSGSTVRPACGRRLIGDAARHALQGLAQLGRGRVAVSGLRAIARATTASSREGRAGLRSHNPRMGARSTFMATAPVSAPTYGRCREQLEQRHPEAVDVAALVEGMAAAGLRGI